MIQKQNLKVSITEVQQSRNLTGTCQKSQAVYFCFLTSFALFFKLHPCQLVRFMYWINSGPLERFCGMQKEINCVLNVAIFTIGWFAFIYMLCCLHTVLWLKLQFTSRMFCLLSFFYSEILGFLFGSKELKLKKKSWKYCLI